MANDDPQYQILLLIREFSSEKTKGERRLTDLKKHLVELQADYEAESAELEKTKRTRESAERELRGSQTQLNRTNASLLALETRISGLQDEISQVSSELQAIRSDDENQRDEFIKTMNEFSGKIRDFNEMAFQTIKKGHPDITSDPRMDKPSGKALKDLENEILSMDAEMICLKGECQNIVNDNNKVSEELADMEKKFSLSGDILLQSERLKELSGQISELEKTYSDLGEEFQTKYVCPKCGFNNIEASEWTSETEEISAI